MAIFNLSETNIGGGETETVTLVLSDNAGRLVNIYIPVDATWTGLEPDMETGEVSGTLTIPKNSMFTLALLLNSTPVASSCTVEKISIGGRPNTYVFVAYVGTQDGTVVLQ